jgi:hypothetical protein
MNYGIRRIAAVYRLGAVLPATELGGAGDQGRLDVRAGDGDIGQGR